MDLELSPAEARFQSELRGWLAANVPRRIAGAGPREDHDPERVARLRAWQRKLHGAGYVAIGWQDASPAHPGVFVRRFPLPVGL